VRAAPNCKACEDRYELRAALEERPAEPTIGVVANAFEFLARGDEFAPVTAAREGPEESELGAYIDVDFSEAAFEDELEADLFTAICRQLGNDEEPEFGSAVEANDETAVRPQTAERVPLRRAASS
jgi:hypothetical protein